MHSFDFIIAKLGMNNFQLLAKDERCANSGSKVMTRIINNIKMGPKTGKVALVGFILTKLALRASGKDSSAFS